MNKQWLVLMAAISLAGCVTTGGEPANVRPEQVQGRANADPVPLKDQFENTRVVQMNYDDAWEYVNKVLPTLIGPRSGKDQKATPRFLKRDKQTGIIEVRDFSYVGWKLPGAPRKEVTCRHTDDPKGKYIGIRLYPAGQGTSVQVMTQYSQMLKDEEWEPETISGQIDGMGLYSGTKRSAHKTASAVYDACKSTWAIESLLLKAFPEKVVVDPVEALSMGNFFRFYETSFYWNQFNNNGPDLTEPHFLAKQTQQLESSTRQMRAAWEDDSLRKKDGWERAPTNKLAIVHAMGYGIPKDAALAVKLFKRVAAHSYIAQYNLGIMYLKGWGVAKNEAEAVEWFKTAAMTCPECTMARNNLGVMYAQGIGVAKDESKAIKLFNEINNLQKKQLHICNLKTIRNLGFMYENGLGVAKDASKAYGYYYAAARFGDIEAQKSKDMLRPQLTIDQIASVLTTPEFQFSDCNPLWSGGWHDQP